MRFLTQRLSPAFSLEAESQLVHVATRVHQSYGHGFL